MALGAQKGRGDDTLRIIEEGSGMVRRSLLVLVVEPNKPDSNSNSTRMAGGVFRGGRMQSCEGGAQSMLTATDPLSSAESTTDTIDERVGLPEIGRWRESALLWRTLGGLTIGSVVVRRKPMRPSDAVDSLSLLELLVEYWESSWSSAETSTSPTGLRRREYWDSLQVEPR
jgi:hypothetical protein